MNLAQSTKQERSANLLAYNNKSQICYCGQISLQCAAVNCSFSDTFGGIIYIAGDGTYNISNIIFKM